jgi:predicted lipid-binding transport protein (Tim44 family)
MQSRASMIRRLVLGACALVLAVGVGAEGGPQRRPGSPTTPPHQAVPQATAAPAEAQTPASEPAQPTTPAVSASARNWWIALLAGLVAALGVVALLARRRARTPGPAPTYQGWQGIGGPSYAPRPVTVRVEPRTTPPETIGGTARTVPLPRRENPRRPFGVPADFDAPAFLADARQSFVRLQSAWDRSDLHELDECTTDEMFNALAHELRVRAGPSRTEVVELTASLLGIETAAGEYRASVRFSGNLKVNGDDERLDEVWNLSRPVDGSSGWLLAGIQQLN